MHPANVDSHGAPGYVMNLPTLTYIYIYIYNIVTLATTDFSGYLRRLEMSLGDMSSTKRGERAKPNIGSTNIFHALQPFW